MRLVPKKVLFYVFINYSVATFQSTFLVPAHTFTSGAAIVCSIPETRFVGCRLRSALQTSGCFLLTENVLSLQILLFGIRRNRKVRVQMSEEVATAHPAIAL
jgi:hypothetical protein